VSDVLHSGASGARNINALFFMLGWAWCSFRKMRVRACYAKLVFLHAMRSASHIVHSDVSGAQNIDTLFFRLRWAQCSF
jgi:hypothetical protein